MMGVGSPDWETWFWAVFASSRNPMMITDADRRIVSANGSLGRLLDDDEDRIVGRVADEFCHVADGDDVDERWLAMLARGGGHRSVVLGTDPAPLDAAAHVAHIGGRLAVLIVFMPAGHDAMSGSRSFAAALTPRERDVVRRLALGATSKEIGADLHITSETVRTHVRNAMEKTGTRTRAHLVAASMCRGLLPTISST